MDDSQVEKNEHAQYLAWLSARKAHKRAPYRHTLAPMCMQDIAEAIGIDVSTLYRRLQNLSIPIKKIKSMPLPELVDFINEQRKIKKVPKNT